MLDARRERVEVDRPLRPRHFVRDELRTGNAGVGDRIPRVDRNRALEIADGLADERRVQAFDFEPALGVRAVRVEAGRLAHTQPSRARRDRQAELARERHRDPVLQAKDVFEQPVHLRVGDRLAAREIHQPRRNPEIRPDALIAAGDDQAGAERGRDLFHRSARLPASLHDAPAIDDAEPIERGEVAGHRLRDACAEPRHIGIAGDVREVQHGETVLDLGCRFTLFVK